MVAVEVAVHHMRHARRVDAGRGHVRGHLAVRRGRGRHAVAGVEHNQRIAARDEGDGEGKGRAVGRQEGVAQHGLDIPVRRVAHEALDRTGEEAVMDGGGGEAAHAEPIEAGRLGDGRRRRRLGAGGPEQPRHGKASAGGEQGEAMGAHGVGPPIAFTVRKLGDGIAPFTPGDRC